MGKQCALCRKESIRQTSDENHLLLVIPRFERNLQNHSILNELAKSHLYNPNKHIKITSRLAASTIHHIRVSQSAKFPYHFLQT